jgi:hypothetical protein
MNANLHPKSNKSNQLESTSIMINRVYICSETCLYVLSVVCTSLVIVCLFVSQRLDDNESKEYGSQSHPKHGYGDYSTQDEDEDQYDIAKEGKPSFDSYPNA